MANLLSHGLLKQSFPLITLLCPIHQFLIPNILGSSSLQHSLDLPLIFLPSHCTNNIFLIISWSFCLIIWPAHLSLVNSLMIPGYAIFSKCCFHILNDTLFSVFSFQRTVRHIHFSKQGWSFWKCFSKLYLCCITEKHIIWYYWVGINSGDI